MNVQIDIHDVVLHTDRLCLRPWRWSDLDDFYAYASVDGVGQMAGWLPHQSKEDSRMILEKFISEKKTFALEFEGRVIGSLGVECYDEQLFPELSSKMGRELGYVLAKDQWGKGFMPEAVQAVVMYLFDTYKLDFLLIGYFKHNQQSKRVAEKCSFVPYKECVHETAFGTMEDTQMMILFNQSKCS